MVGKLPFWSTLAESLRMTGRHLTAAYRLGWLLMAAVFLTDVAYEVIVAQMAAPVSLRASLIVLTLLSPLRAAAIAMFAVSWHRRILRDDDSPSLWSCRGPTGRYFLLIFVTTGIETAVDFALILPLEGWFLSVAPEDVAAAMMLLIPYLIAVIFVSAFPLSLAFVIAPALALGATFKDAFKVLPLFRGNLMRSALLVAFAYTLLNVALLPVVPLEELAAEPLASLALMVEPAVAQAVLARLPGIVLEVALTPALAAFALNALSLAYAHVTAHDRERPAGAYSGGEEWRSGKRLSENF